MVICKEQGVVLPHSSGGCEVSDHGADICSASMEDLTFWIVSNLAEEQQGTCRKINSEQTASLYDSPLLGSAAIHFHQSEDSHGEMVLMDS